MLQQDGDGVSKMASTATNFIIVFKGEISRDFPTYDFFFFIKLFLYWLNGTYLLWMDFDIFNEFEIDFTIVLNKFFIHVFLFTFQNYRGEKTKFGNFFLY